MTPNALTVAQFTRSTYYRQCDFAQRHRFSRKPSRVQGDGSWACAQTTMKQRSRNANLGERPRPSTWSPSQSSALQQASSSAWAAVSSRAGSPRAASWRCRCRAASRPPLGSRRTDGRYSCPSATSDTSAVGVHLLCRPRINPGASQRCVAHDSAHWSRRMRRLATGDCRSAGVTDSSSAIPLAAASLQNRCR